MGERARIALVCGVCGARNYRTTKAQDKREQRLEIKKFCPACNQHTVHKESK